MLPIGGINPPAGSTILGREWTMRKYVRRSGTCRIIVEPSIWIMKCGRLFMLRAAEISRSIEKLARVLPIAHEAVPGARIGYL